MMEQALYRQLAKYYDRFYEWKNYEKELDFLMQIFERYGIKGKNILEVACGTGNHTKLLTAHGYHVTGVDLSEEMLRIARQKVRKNVIFIRGDMRNLGEINGRFDAILYMFSSIEYNITLTDLKALQGMYDRTKDGGIVIFDTHFLKEAIIDGYKATTGFIDGKIRGARLSVTKVFGNTAKIYFDYLISDGRRLIELRNDVHKIGLFTFKQTKNIMLDAGFVKVDVYADFTLKKLKGTNKSVRDYVFVGNK